MSGFSFGFSTDDVENFDKSDSTSGANKQLQWFPAKELTFDSDPLLPSSYLHSRGSVQLEIANSEEVLKLVSENENSCAKAADSVHSDLVPAFYEGGLKIWECTDDLLDFISRPIFKEKLQNSKVLDLGCGSGAIGIYCLLSGASEVHFQDYNEEVLKFYTRPNVTLNLFGDNVTDKVKYFAGDWSSFADLMKNYKYDFIFTSETIYSQECYPKLLKIFKNHLNDSGEIYLGAKTYYFGVGGGTRLFESALEKEATLKSEQVWKCDEGLHREILRITKAITSLGS
ncbi:histidine protein methyltransferase 1 homolog [Neocloeon triangulifer]|uniref:histidine protein methyltransferase 1 homolog n=1 Tax=Neocloeon triangulifer TaxID=2078957 RepID=UPI00286EC4EA|nr:histidine protein methyltransferase 1 homolog [Neocloeon triangulifer]XP_059476274.1 histidine protein methyltransferase 1 homolog [Neocloeon triangulifer]XP_059476275.1 histidine protein methyltransferase 1 homolog [Neocloeon triangulifer]